jgi:predicted enzyme related to lactoylglutathione lyase
MTRFERYRLRTTDIASARAFYAALLRDIPLDLSLLPPDAVAHGARPHWIGHLGVHDVEGMLRAYTARGATRLGPLHANERGGVVAIVRDAGGLIVALESHLESTTAPPVVWHGAHTRDAPGAVALHRELFGWHFGSTIEDDAVGVTYPFAWTSDDAVVGSIASIEHRPAVHAHWLFHFAVPDLERAIAVVEERGGFVLGPFVTREGDRIAVCDDPQGAAFALRTVG